jgi:hypothetical protein
MIILVTSSANIKTPANVAFIKHVILTGEKIILRIMLPEQIKTINLHAQIQLYSYLCWGLIVQLSVNT